MSDFRKLPYKRISTTDLIDFELEETPAIYAWYRSLDFRELVDSEEHFKDYIGGIQFQYFEGFTGELGYMRWDKDRVFAVAVDGQHRLAAIKRTIAEFTRERQESTKIPVIFLVPSEQVGFAVEPKKGSDRPIQSLRNIFIDLNKYAKPVSRARNILLDDLDIASICTRYMISDSLGEEVRPDQIPLSAVDWVSEVNKVEDGPFLTTVLMVDDAVRLAIRHSYFIRINDKDYESEDKFAEALSDWVNGTFGANKQQSGQITEQGIDCFQRQVDITFTSTEISILRDLFDKNWRPFLAKIFTKTSQFAEILQTSKKVGFLKPEMVNLYIAHTRAESAESIKGKRETRGKDEAKQRYNKIVQVLQKEHEGAWNQTTKFLNPLKEIENKKGDKWSFKIVFQRALVLAYLRYIEGESLVDRGNKTDYWVNCVNDLLNSDLGITDGRIPGKRRRFWLGSGLKPDTTIDFSKSASERISWWLQLWVTMRSAQSIPAYDDLLSGDSKSQTISQLKNCVTNQKLRRGMEVLARAQDGDLDDEKLERATNRGIKLRYMGLLELRQQVRSK